MLPRGSIFGQDAPSNKLNIALIGAYGRATAHYNAIKGENVVAICDVDKNNLAKAAEVFPKAKQYEDWRKCLEQKDINAVVICTPDFSHAIITMWAMNRGFHVYCEKPVAISVEEARLVRATYLKNKGKIATQIGTQRHAIPNFNRVRELVKDGAIGELKSVYAWGDRQIRRPGYLPAAGEPPKTLNYDLWLGPAQFHPYNPGYFAGGCGSNCLSWNMYWDFGTGQVGDMGAHTMDLAWNAIDAEVPTSIEASGEKFNPEVTPVELKATFDIPANDWRPAIKASWFQGGEMPTSPKGYVNLKNIGHGAMFKGSQGYIIADFDSRIVMPYGSKADMTYYKPRSTENIIPDVGAFQQEWIDACKGNLKTSCDFDYAGKMSETMLLGLVAYRVGKKISYDGASGKVTDCDEANALLSKKYREGWTLNG